MEDILEKLNEDKRVSDYSQMKIFNSFTKRILEIPDEVSDKIVDGSVFEEEYGDWKRWSELQPGDTIKVGRLNTDFECVSPDGHHFRLEDVFEYCNGIEVTQHIICHITRIENDCVYFVVINGSVPYEELKIEDEFFYGSTYEEGRIYILGHHDTIAQELMYLHEFKARFSNKVKEAAKQRMTKIKEIAEMVYPGNVDMTLMEEKDLDLIKQKMSDEVFGILTVRFPEFTITNSKSEEHTITDLYVVFGFNIAGILTCGIYGIRGKMEVKEFNTGYTHSHLGGERESLNSFCLGRGSFSNSINILRSEWDEELLEIALTQLRYYLEWESLEGGPFKRMQKAIAGTSTARVYLLQSKMDDLFKYIRKNAPDELLDNVMGVQIQDNGDGTSDITTTGWTKVAEWVTDHLGEITSQLETPPESIIIYVNTEGSQISNMKLKQARRILANNSLTGSFYFKGERIEQEIFLDETLYADTYTDTIPAITKDARFKLEQRMIASFMDVMADEININTQTEKYNEHRKQITTFPERILTTTTVF